MKRLKSKYRYLQIEREYLIKNKYIRKYKTMVCVALICFCHTVCSADCAVFILCVWSRVWYLVVGIFYITVMSCQSHQSLLHTYTLHKIDERPDQNYHDGIFCCESIPKLITDIYYMHRFVVLPICCRQNAAFYE